MGLIIKLDKGVGTDGFYVKRNEEGVAKTNWRYIVEGPDDEIDAYLESKGGYARQKDSGEALFFSGNYVGESNHLIKTQAGTYVAARSTKVEKIKSTCNQLGDSPLGRAFANIAAQELYAQLGLGATVQVPQPVPSEKAPVDGE